MTHSAFNLLRAAITLTPIAWITVLTTLAGRPAALHRPLADPRPTD
jgi:hypothetical protein